MFINKKVTNNNIHTYTNIHTLHCKKRSTRLEIGLYEIFFNVINNDIYIRISIIISNNIS